MNAWLSLVTGLKYFNISKTSPPDGLSNCGYWLTVQMATLQTNVYIGKAARKETSEFGFGYDVYVVMRLLGPFLNLG